MISIPSFSSGERLSAAKLNALADAVRELQREAAASRITSVNGGTFSRTAGGTSLDIHRVVPTPPPAAAAPSFDHPFKVSLIPPAEKGGKYRVKVNPGRAYAPRPYHANTCFFTPVFHSSEPGYIGAYSAELPDGAKGLYILAAAKKSGILFNTYEKTIGDEKDVILCGKVNGWTFVGAGLFFNPGITVDAPLFGGEDGTVFTVADFTWTTNADGDRTVSVSQQLFSHIFLPYWIPSNGFNEEGWL